MNVEGVISEERLNNDLKILPLIKDDRCRELIIDVIKSLAQSLNISEQVINKKITSALKIYSHCTLCTWRSVKEDLRQVKCKFCNHPYPLVTGYTPNDFIKVRYACVMCSKTWNICFAWEANTPLARVEPWRDTPEISPSDLRKQYEDKMQQLIKEDPEKNKDQIDAIDMLLKIAE